MARSKQTFRWCPPETGGISVGHRAYTQKITLFVALVDTNDMICLIVRSGGGLERGHFAKYFALSGRFAFPCNSTEIQTHTHTHTHIQPHGHEDTHACISAGETHCISTMEPTVVVTAVMAKQLCPSSFRRLLGSAVRVPYRMRRRTTPPP